MPQYGRGKGGKELVDLANRFLESLEQAGDMNTELDDDMREALRKSPDMRDKWVG
jgi:hypothetical protein